MNEAKVRMRGQITRRFVHSAHAREVAFKLDIFCPPRRDWIYGDDAYRRR